jgi:gliding motility-associated-like protein
MRTLRLIGFLIALNTWTSWGQTSITMPNIFTPNGDGINDVFRIQTTGYDQLTCTIYNRHGEPIYRFYGLNGTWDGFTHAGIKVTAGVYFVFLEAELSDGSSETRQGTIQVQY